jgi:aryl-alcohol dehydrogenase-like predicted oxidoreductase
MSRTYQTTVPFRPEMLSIIRAAFENGVTFFDSAEAYGPVEVERIRRVRSSEPGRDPRRGGTRSGRI